MTEVAFLSSLQGYQTSRERELVDRLKSERPDLTVRYLPPAESAPLLTKYKLKFGPAVLINDRLEFIGVPRYRMLLERIEIAKQRAAAPPKPAPVTSPAPAGGIAPPPAPNAAAPGKPADSSG